MGSLMEVGILLCVAGGDKIELKCSAMLQKEVPPNGLVDEECGDTIKEGQAGLCE